jgi:hypothetical protein
VIDADGVCDRVGVRGGVTVAVVDHDLVIDADCVNVTDRVGLSDFVAVGGRVRVGLAVIVGVLTDGVAESVSV